MAAPRRPAGRVPAVALVAAAVFGLALATAATVLPFGSLNRDESTYVEMADLLAHGRLTLPADEHLAFRPWASGVVGDRIVVKYTPPWPAVVALFGLAGEGARRAAPAAAAAAGVVLVHALARRAGGRRPASGAVAAAAAFGLSPLIVVQGATVLSYVFQLDLGLGAALLLLRGTRRSALAAGVVTGIAVVARPFDAVLFVGPFAAVALWRHRHLLVPYVVGGLPPGLLLAVYDAVLLGSPFRLPYTVTGTADGFGFGERGVFPGATVPFDAIDGLTATVANGGWLLAWAFGGPLLLVLAVAGYRRCGPSEARRALTGVAVLYPLGYLCFWGSHAIVHFWRGAATLGPFYHLPLLVPLAVFGGHGLVALGSRRRTALALVTAVLVTVAWVPPKLRANEAGTRVYAAADRATRDLADGGPAVLFAPDRGLRGFDSWTPFLHNDPGLRQPVLYADERGGRDLDVAAALADRRLLRLVPRPTTASPRRFRVEELAVVPAAAVVTLAVELHPPAGARAVQPYLVTGRRELHQSSPPDGRLTWRLSADPAAAPFDALLLLDRRGVVAAGVEVTGADGRRRRYEQRVAYRRTDGGIELLVPGRGFRRLRAAWVPADVADVVRTGQGT